MRKKILRKIGGMVLAPVITMWMKTLKIKVNNKPDTLNGKFVGAFWHGKMLAGWYLFRNNNPVAVVSSSPDGELLAKLLKFWKYEIIRGSSGKGGKKALEEMIKKTESFKNVIITPDGPTGPPFKFKAGAVITAKKGGIPLLLCGIGYKKSFKFSSWDSFELPFPFTTVYVYFSEPIKIEKNLDYEETNKKILDAEYLLNKLTKTAEKAC